MEEHTIVLSDGHEFPCLQIGVVAMHGANFHFNYSVDTHWHEPEEASNRIVNHLVKIMDDALNGLAYQDMSGGTGRFYYSSTGISEKVACSVRPTHVGLLELRDRFSKLNKYKEMSQWSIASTE